MDDETTTDSTQPTELPTDLTSLTDEQLSEALASAQAEGAELRNIDLADMSEEQVARLEALADFAERVAGQQEANAEAAAERAQRAEAAASRLSGGDDAGDGDGEEGGEDAPAETTEEAPAEGAEQTEAVAAGGSRTARRAPVPAPRRQPTPAQQTATSGATLVAAAGIGSVEAGSTLPDMAAVVQAFVARSKGFPTGVSSTKHVRHQYGVASIQRNLDKGPDGLHYSNVGGDFRSVQELLEAAAKESRLKDGSLVAAGGWCSPSETLYDLVSPETLDGIIDLPTVGIDRGGINYTPGPDFADIFTSAGFSQTEAEAIAGDTKDCAEVDCPDFTEVRLDAVGICVKAPLLTRAAYPELIQRWLEGTVVANQHKVAARLITAMRTALGTALAPTLTGTPVTWSTLTAIELVIETQRQAYRLSESETLEVKAPRWLRLAIRADLANRSSIAAESVSNAQIAQHFADRGAAVQWILNYQELSGVTAVAIPSTVEVMVYPAGTFVKGTADVIDLSTMYDTADLVTNTYTAAFVEDGVLLAKMRHGGKRITLPVNVTGLLGANQLDDTWGTAQVENAGAAAA